MMMVELTSVASNALPVSELTEHLRLASGFTDDGSQDGQLESCLRAALSAIEARIGKALFERRFGLQLTTWHEAEAHALPIAPVSAIESIKIISRGGDEALVDPARYRLVVDTHRPVVKSAGARLPTPSTGGTIDMEFVAGFGATWSEIPADLRQAVLIQAAEFYERTPNPEAGIPFAVTVLIEPYRALRLRGRGA